MFLMVFSFTAMKITQRLNLILGSMIHSVLVSNFVLLVLTILRLTKLLIQFVMIMVLSLKLLVIFQVSPHLLKLVLRLNRSRNSFLKLPMSALNKEVI